MKLRSLFEKQIFIRLTDDQTAFICTAKWSLLTRSRRVCVNDAGRDVDPQVMESGSFAGEELPMLRRIRIE